MPEPSTGIAYKWKPMRKRLDSVVPLHMTSARYELTGFIQWIEDLLAVLQQELQSKS